MVSTFLDFEISAGVKTNPQKLSLSTGSRTHPEGQRLSGSRRCAAQHALAIPHKAIARLYLAAFSADNHARIFPMIS
jgi:hypothetical protein